MAIRFFIGLVASVLIWCFVLKMLDIPGDKALPPAMSEVNMTLHQTGYITGTTKLGYSQHLWDGQDGDEYFINYKFKPSVNVKMPDGSRKNMPQNMWQTGQAQCDANNMKDVDVGDSIAVTYDPYNPLINKLDWTNTVNTGVTFWSGWLWYLVGVLVTGFIIGELLKVSFMPDL